MWSGKYFQDFPPVSNKRLAEWIPPQPQQYKVNWLDLSKFKTQKCLVLDPKHNKKHCFHYHNDSDRRRNPFEIDYKCDLCPQVRNCPTGENCLFSHNKVEQLYHPNRYKTKYCQKIWEACEYQKFCTFAHSDDEINIPLILDKMTQDENFWLNNYKTVWCPYIQNHDRGICVYAHNAQDFRRDLQVFPYIPQECTNWNKSQQVTSYEQGGCPEMDRCKFCHGWKELEYHPLRFRTKRCSYGISCTKRRKDCPYYHDESDRRQPTQKEKDIKTVVPIKLLADHPNKLLSGQPFEVFSSSSLTNNTSNGSRKMSDTSNESKIPQQRTQRGKKEMSPKKNRSAPSTPEQNNFIFIQSQEDDTLKEGTFDYTSMFSEQLISLLDERNSDDILNVLCKQSINEQKLLQMSVKQFQQIPISQEKKEILKQVVDVVRKNVSDMLKQFNTDYGMDINFKF